MCESCEQTVLLGIQITCFAFYINTLGIIIIIKKDIYVFDWMVVCMPSMFPSCLLILNITTNVAYLFVNARGEAYISVHFLWVIWKWQIKWILLITFSKCIQIFFVWRFRFHLEQTNRLMEEGFSVAFAGHKTVSL